MADVKWIKLTTDMFDNRKIKHLRKLPEGNNIVLIWVMLLTMAGRCNSGGMVFLTENIPYTPKMLADELEFEENTVKLALQALEQLGMVVMQNDYFCIAGWEEHQNIGGLEKIREQNRIRQAKFKQKQKALPQGNVTDNVMVTQGNATDIDKEEDIRSNTNVLQKKKKEKKPDGFAAILAGIEDERLHRAYLDYIEMRKTIKAPMTERALQMLINRVNELENNMERQVQLLETAVLNNWKSVYPLRDQQAQPRAAQPTATDAFMDKLKSMYNRE